MQPEKKMKRLENRELFQDFNRTIASVLFEENTYPWEVLPKIHDFIMEVGMLLSQDEYEEVKMLAEGTVNNSSEVLEVK